MGIRETLNKKPGVAIGVAIGLVAVAIAFLTWQLGAGEAGGPTRTAFYTDDDGKTTFLDDIDKVAPFDRNGKEAVRAHVFTCDDGKTQFVAYLERYTPDAAAKIRDIRASGKLYELKDDLVIDSSEVKRPGEGKWEKRTSPAASEIATPKCPNGASGQIRMVEGG